MAPTCFDYTFLAHLFAHLFPLLLVVLFLSLLLFLFSSTTPRFISHSSQSSASASPTVTFSANRFNSTPNRAFKTVNTVMADVFSAQRPEMADVPMSDVDMLHADDAFPGDPMDTSPIPSPAQQLEINSQPMSFVPSQNTLPPLAPLSHIGLTSLSPYRNTQNTAPRHASIDDPYPWGRLTPIQTPFIRPRSRFSPKSHPKFNSALSATHFVGLNGSLLTTRGPSHNPVAYNPNLRATRGSSHDSVACNPDSFYSVPPPLLRKRSLDEEYNQVHPTAQVSDSNPSKYRRLSKEGFVSSNTTHSNGDFLSAQSHVYPPLDSLEGHQPSDMSSHVTEMHGVAGEQSVDHSTNTASRIPGGWPDSSPFTPTDHASEGYSVPVEDGHLPRDQFFRSGAFTAAPAPAPPTSHILIPSNDHHIPTISSSDAETSQTENMDTLQDGMPVDTRRSRWASLYETAQRVYTAPREVTQAMIRAATHAVSLAGSFRRHALGFFRRRRPAPTRRSPTRANLRALPEEQRQRLLNHQWHQERGYPTVEHYAFPELDVEIPQFPISPASSPQAESNVEEQQQPLQDHQWHRDMRYPTVEDDLFVESNIEIPRRRLGAILPPQVESHAGPSTIASKKPAKTLKYSRKRTRQLNRSQGTHAASPCKEARHHRPPSGIQKRPLVQSLSPQLKRRMLQQQAERNPRVRQMIRSAPRFGPDGIPLKYPATVTGIPEHLEATVPKDQGEPQPKQKRKVRFREPLTETVPETLFTELAPHLSSPRVDRIAKKPTDQEKENIPPALEVEAEREILSRGVEPAVEPVVDPWVESIEFPLGRPVSAVSLFYPIPKPLPPGRMESIYAAEWKKIQEEEKRKERPARVRPEGPAVRPLPAKWATKLSEIITLPNNRKIATTLYGDPLMKKDLSTCYTRMAWLNDEVINSYLALIVDYLRRSNGNAGRHDKPRFHAFNSFFFSTLRDKGYEHVRRWASRAKIGGEALLDVDTVFIPVHNSAHWTLIVVKPSERTIENFDSLGSLSRRHVGLVKDWLRGELGSRYINDEWTVLPSISPQQDNGSDCGVFLLSTAKAVAIGIEPLSYGAEDIPLLRYKIVAELMNGGLEGDFDPTEGGQALL